MAYAFFNISDIIISVKNACNISYYVNPTKNYFCTCKILMEKNMSSVEVKPVALNKKALKPFVTFPWKIYKGNKYWVPPIISDQINNIIKGAYHEVGVIQPFLAYRDGKIVGRIIAHYDNRYNEYFNDKRGAIGFFESIDDTEVSRALFSAAEDWLKQRGMKEMHGPFNFLMYDASGILLDDYENIPVIELNYNPLYYVNLFENYGFIKGSDWYAYLMSTKHEFPSLFYKIHKQIEKKALEHKDGLTIRNINLKKYPQERDKIKEVFNKAWEQNLGHYPLTDGQIEAFGKDLKLIAREEFIIFIEYHNELVGFIITLPDANLALQKANGKLFPFGLIKILWHLRKVKRVKVFMMGILPEYRRRGLDVFLYVESLIRGQKIGIKEGDFSLIVETNTDMINALEHMGAKRYKTYRFYKKSIG